MKSVALVLALVLSTALATGAARADGDARAVFVGSWQGSGTFYASAYSKAGPSTDRTTCGWQVETTYLVCAQVYDGPFGAGRSLSVYTHTGDAYGFVGVNPDGTTRTAKLTARPDGSLIYDSAFDDKSGHVMMQTVNTFPTPGTENWYVQYSLDGGKSWTRMADGVVHRSS